MPALAPVNLRDWAHTAAQRGWGAGWPSCSGAAGNLAVVTFARSGVRVSVHKRIARLVQILADETERRGYLAKQGQTGAYNCRAIAGTNSPSNHSWGLAIDWNWNDNPYTTRDVHTTPQWMYDLWAAYGFANGSMYSGARDWMHLEAMGSPEQMDDATARAIHDILGAPQWIEEADMAVPVLREGDGVRGGGERGSYHWWVASVQALCNIRGLSRSDLPVTGEFGPDTTAMVRELQQRRGIPVTGVVDAETWKWLLGNVAPDFA